MLSGNYYIIKEIESNYDEIIMVCLSGGGWQTTMTSSLLPKIKYSYSFAGSLPVAYHILDEIPHPVETINSKIWQEYDFWHFFFFWPFWGLVYEPLFSFFFFGHLSFFFGHFFDILGDLKKNENFTKFWPF